MIKRGDVEWKRLVELGCEPDPHPTIKDTDYFILTEKTILTLDKRIRILEQKCGG